MPAEGPAVPAAGTASSYSTGGGGVTFEHRVGAGYLAILLTGDAAPELGDGRRILNVSFQQRARSAVDDLVILAGRADEAEPSLELAVAIRRAPQIIPSNEDTQKLIDAYVRDLLAPRADDCERRWALVVAGPQLHAGELAELAALAANQRDGERFFSLMGSGGHRRALRQRLDSLTRLVAHGLSAAGIDSTDPGALRARTWEFLSRLAVVMPRIEASDVTDRVGTRNRLVAVARGSDLASAGALLERLETLAAEFGPSAGAIDLPLLRRKVHALLDLEKWHHQVARSTLQHLEAQALATVSDHVGRAGERDVHLDRTAEGEAVAAAATKVGSLVVYGESGIGKSALVLSAMTTAAKANPDSTQVMCLNLRHLPESSLELVKALGCPLASALGEVSAHHRFLVIDGADAAVETRREAFIHLLRAARASDVRVVAVTGNEARKEIHDLLKAHLASDVTDHAVAGLSDAQLGQIADAFPELARLVANPRSRELLRRLIVVDLLVRTQFSGLPLSDADAMDEIWAGLVRGGRGDRGLPDARERALLLLANHELRRTPNMDEVARFDALAIDGLRKDGLLQAAVANSWDPLPAFAHDELRRYAVARVLLADGDPAAVLLAPGEWRWALSAARLACQALLGLPDRAGAPLPGRLSRMQAAFDAVAKEHGARWGDLPGEALLTLGDPRPLLIDGWSDLEAGDATGLRRLIRLIDQRHRDRDGSVDPVIAEPIVALLLDESTPWRSSDEVTEFLRDWLRALVVHNTAVGHAQRIRVRDRLVEICDAGERRLVEEHLAAEARQARTPAASKRAKALLARHPDLFTEVGFGPRERKERPAVPHELTDDTVLELLGLLGPDLGEDGERLLRRVAQDAPWQLAPALEELITGRALATYGRGLLADLTQAYYLDDEEDGSGFHEDGIRDHHWRGPVAPLAAWYRGPFIALFQTDLRGGIAVLNRMLNHSARARVRTRSRLGSRWGPVADEAVDGGATIMSVTGAARGYSGDDQVWSWYRGTGFGPYPCMSALQALERACDMLVEAGVPVSRLVPVLLAGCESLAMLGLVVGLLVRHLERAGTLLDRFLAEPVVWSLEFNRAVRETSGLAALSDGLVNADRRAWTLREAAAWLVLNADPVRAEQLRAIGRQLVEAAARTEGAPASDGRGGEPAEDERAAAAQVSFVTQVRNWASALDRERYTVRTDGVMTIVETAPPDDVLAALAPRNEDLRRGQEGMRLVSRYFLQSRMRPGTGAPFTDEELQADLTIAQELLEDPPAMSVTGKWDGPAAVSAAATEAVLLRGMRLPSGSINIAIATLLAVAEGAREPSEYEYEGTLFEQAADRSAARALPLLLLPEASSLRELYPRAGGVPAEQRALAACATLARAVPTETRLHLARGLDALWRAPCGPSPCHHRIALDLAGETMRDCALGPWDAFGQRRTVSLADPLASVVASLADNAILFGRLDPAIRALGEGVAHDTCVRGSARELLLAVLIAQRRGLTALEHGGDERGSHALVAARALLNLAASGDDVPLQAHIAAYADSGALLGSFLRALAAAAEENSVAAEAARRIWPGTIAQVLELDEAGHDVFDVSYFGQAVRAALIPNTTYEGAFLYREIAATPHAWTDALAWRPQIEAWLSVATGSSQCVDALIGLVRTLPVAEQVTTGLTWVSSVVLADVDAVAGRCYRLADWLVEIREYAVDANVNVIWQRLVDALVVAGEDRLSGYAE